MGTCGAFACSETRLDFNKKVIGAGEHLHGRRWLKMSGTYFPETRTLTLLPEPEFESGQGQGNKKSYRRKCKGKGAISPVDWATGSLTGLKRPVQSLFPAG